jgi:Immunity protein family (Imm11)
MALVALDYRRFFALGEAFTRLAFRVHALGDIPDPYALTRAEVVPDHPIRFHYDQGTRLYDYIGTTWAVLDLVSERMIAVLRDHDFTGWATYPIEMYDATGDLVPGYHGLAVSGRCGPIDESMSPVMEVPPPVPGGATLPHRIGLRFWQETWDGSDIFSPEGTAWVLVAQTVRDALIKAKVRNISLTRITEIEQLVIDESERRDDLLRYEPP